MICRSLHFLFFALLCAFFLPAPVLNGQPAAPPESGFTYLTRDENADWSLELNWADMLLNRRKFQYYPAILTDQAGRTYPVRVKTRGKFRLKTCDIPPIQIKFSKENLHEYGLDTLDEMDISLPCMSTAKGADLLLREYVVYRMYEQMVPAAAVRARLVRLSIRDAQTGRSFKMLAMAVEDEEEMVARLNASLLEEYGMAPERLDMPYAARMVMFQYMIGNTDWDIPMFRNIQLVQPHESGRKIMTIPYDFDFSGFVSAPYAVPPTGKGLRNVRDRLLMDTDVDPDAFSAAIEALKNARPGFNEWCRHPLISSRTADQLIRYLDTFFKAVEQENSVPKKMMVSRM